jgi:hypothetical protein
VWNRPRVGKVVKGIGALFDHRVTFPAMKGLLNKAYRRRLYILASFAILGLQVCAYSALLVLWGTSALDKYRFSLSRLSLVSQVISVVSQAFALSSLAALISFVQPVAVDRVIRRRACVR